MVANGIHGDGSLHYFGTEGPLCSQLEWAHHGCLLLEVLHQPLVIFKGHVIVCFECCLIV